jgi:hypothetical protein
VLAGLTLIDGRLAKTAGGTVDGHVAPGMPVAQVNLGGALDLPPWLAKGLTLTGLVIHTASQSYDQADRQTIPAYTRLDLGFRYSFAAHGTPLTACLNIENAAGARYGASARTEFLSYGAPRTFLASLTADFRAPDLGGGRPRDRPGIRGTVRAGCRRGSHRPVRDGSGLHPVHHAVAHLTPHHVTLHPVAHHPALHATAHHVALHAVHLDRRDHAGGGGDGGRRERSGGSRERQGAAEGGEQRGGEDRMTHGKSPFLPPRWGRACSTNPRRQKIHPRPAQEAGGGRIGSQD